MSESQSVPTESPTPGEGRTLRRARLAIRCGMLVATAIVVWPLASYATAAMVTVAVSPFVAIGSAVAARTIGWTALVAAPVMVLSIGYRRWFCRWLCPTGLVCEQVGRIGSSAGRRAPAVIPVGQWIAIATLAGAAVGYPVFLWLDPLSLLAAFLRTPWRDPWSATALASSVGLAVVLLLSLIAPGLWCARICPLGATQELLAGRLRPGVMVRRTAMAGDGWRLSRRVAMAGGLGAAWAWTVRRTPAGYPHVMRPPGALEEIRFRGVCVRCGNCIHVCPTRILHADPGETGLSGLLCPVVQFGPGYCREDCRRCGDACPSGAIARLSGSEKASARMGVAVVDPDLCLLSDNRECSVCKNVCPYGAVSTVWSDEQYTLTLKIDPDRCPGCGACQVACPTEPRRAITVKPVSGRP